MTAKCLLGPRRAEQQWQEELQEVKSPWGSVCLLVGQHVGLSRHARPPHEPIEGSWRLSTDFNGLWIKPMACCLFVLDAF